MGGSITWRGGPAGVWTAAANWGRFLLPDDTDTVTIGAGDTVEIGAGVFATAAALDLAGATLWLEQGGTLRVGGGIALSGGTLAVTGVVAGGTLSGVGRVLGAGGTLDGTVVQGGLSGLGDLTITTATVAANAAQPITPSGTLTLAAGRYDAAVFSLNAAAGGVVELAAAPTATVVLGTATTIDGGGAGAVLGGATLTNLGSIAVAPAATLETQIVYQPNGKYGALIGISLTWTASVAPTLRIAAAHFLNAGLLSLSGGTLQLIGPGFRNTGRILLADATGETPQRAADGSIAVIATTFATAINVGAAVADFSNSGTIQADSIRFDGAVRLAQLGTLTGALTFAGTLDLGGGRLDATASDPVTITGTVLHGTLTAPLASTGLTLNGAALRGVVLAGGTASASGTLHALGGGGLTLEAGAVLSAGAALTLTGGPGGAIVNNGTIAAGAGATVTVLAGLGGAGTVELGDNAVVTIGVLALTAAPTFLFGPGAALLALPGLGVGVTLASLHDGDMVDLTGLSSLGGGQAGAGVVGDTLAVMGASGVRALLALAAPAHGLGFMLVADSHGGTLLTVN